MSAWDKKVARIKEDSEPLSFSDVKLVCDRLFGPPRTHGSHLTYKMPWQGDPRISIQNRNGFVSPYQVRQVAKAIARWEEEHD